MNEDLVFELVRDGRYLSVRRRNWSQREVLVGRWERDDQERVHTFGNRIKVKMTGDNLLQTNEGKRTKGLQQSREVEFVKGIHDAGEESRDQGALKLGGIVAQVQLEGPIADELDYFGGGYPSFARSVGHHHGPCHGSTQHGYRHRIGPWNLQDHQ